MTGLAATRLLLCGPEAEMPGLSLIVSLGIHIVPDIYSFVNSGYFVNFSFSFSFVVLGGAGCATGLSYGE